MTEKKSKKWVVAAVIFAVLAVLPFLLPMFRVNLIGKYMCFAIIALGLDMIWGYTGIMSLGHGVYFGLGAYVMAMYLKLEASGGALPDFMTWSGFDSLPFWWVPFGNAGFAFAMVVVVPVVVAVVIGLLTFLNRIRGVYFTILSQALAMILSVLLIGCQQYTGGSNGLTDFDTLLGFSLDSGATKLALYYITLFALIAIFCLCTFLVGRRVGKILVAIRDSENRVRFTGYNTALFKVFVYALSAAIAGIAGALYVAQVGIITPSDVAVSGSIEMIIWVAIGGKGTLVGPILGALVVNGVKTFASESFPDLWSYGLGLVCVLVILFLPGGLMSIKDVPARIRAWRERRQGGAGLPASAELTEEGSQA
ncbi:urea ABC transporter permease subunit UrtC [Paratractidigestivibacter sp.]|uniref:urea ABC transporter permease subunit UrtC n=1 Tax=Paratractidigestivibacter sp. TaxID=2847316 RepID=UPI002ABD54E8|nr:urea ABC transporter permease subunit UrtC [Paratractidigestivibacter sp.]